MQRDWTERLALLQGVHVHHAEGLHGRVMTAPAVIWSRCLRPHDGARGRAGGFGATIARYARRHHRFRAARTSDQSTRQSCTFSWPRWASGMSPDSTRAISSGSRA